VADAPWRCSQCGTVNEPNANACRSCGRWPSLFDLEQSTLEEKPPAFEREQAAVEEPYRHDAPLPEELELPIEPVEPDETGRAGLPEEVEGEQPPRGWPQRIGTLIVPIAFLVYIVISIVSNR